MQLGATMRLLWMLLLVQVISITTYGQDRTFLIGETQDCFAGRLIHPAQVDIYLLDSLKSQEIVAILNDMEKEAPRGNAQNADAFFASYQRLTSTIRKTNTLGHVRSDETGRFSFHGLKAKPNSLLLLGIAEREDEPAYYAYMPLKLQPGKNSVILDFDRGNVCAAHGD
jgi:hypothetical protein